MLPPSASITTSIRIRNWEHVFSISAGGNSMDGGDQAGLGVVGGHVHGDVLDV